MLKKIKRIAMLGMAAMLLFSLGLSGCGNSNQGDSGEGNAEGEDNGGYVIGFSNFSLSNSWRPQLEAEFKARAEVLKAEGVISEYYMTNANEDISKQIADMRDLITKKCDAIIITAASPDALSPVCEEAMDAGIKVVSFDNYVQTDNITAKVGIDEVAFGEVGAQWLADQLGGKGNIIMLNGTAGTSVNEMRNRGAMNVFEKYPDIKIIGEAYAKWDYAEGKRAVEGFLSAFQQIDGVWSQGGAMTQASLDAFLSAGRPLVPMSGEANNGLLIAWQANVDNGFDSIAPCSPTYMSADALNLAIDALDEKSFEFNTILELPVITSETLDEYVRPDLPDSFWNITKLNEEQISELFQ